MPPSDKLPGAFLTIGEVSAELGIAQHVLRYWETKFPQLKPLQRAGNRRYYRAADVDLARRIAHLLNEQGYTIRGVQQLLEGGAELVAPPENAAEPAFKSDTFPLERLKAVRDRLESALADHGPAGAGIFRS